MFESYTYLGSDEYYNLEKIPRFLGNQRRYIVVPDLCMFGTEFAFLPHT
jgi:hypothetical protein